MARRSLVVLIALLMGSGGPALPGEPLPGTAPLDWDGDPSARMVRGIDGFLLERIAAAAGERRVRWSSDYSSAEAYSRSLEPRRNRLRKIIGAVDPRLSLPALELVATTAAGPKVAETPEYEVLAVRWPVFPRVHGEGLLLRPRA